MSMSTSYFGTSDFASINSYGITMSTPPSIALYLKKRMHKLKIYGVSDLMQHIDTFNQTMGDDSEHFKIEFNNNFTILLCSLPPLLTALACNKAKINASLRFPHERWPEVISWKPRAFLYHNFLTNEECEHLISLAKPKMAPPMVRARSRLLRGWPVKIRSQIRIGRGQDKIVEEIENRISEFTFIPVEYGEGLHVIHYEVGQKLAPHFDYTGKIATFLMYLSDVEIGGETAFPVGGLSVLPKKRDAVLFWNKRPDGSQDPSSKHAARPVIKGNKWASTKWFYSQELKTTNREYNSFLRGSSLSRHDGYSDSGMGFGSGPIGGGFGSGPIGGGFFGSGLTGGGFFG